MLFKERHVGPIERGEKTQTRRVWKRCHVRVGGTYPVQLRMFAKNADALGWIRVTAIRKEALAMISPEDARAEGGYTTTEFLTLFENINRGVTGSREVHVVEFEYVGKVRP
jgi:hypothetical protein